MLRGENGFTLIEALVIMTMIAVLAAIAFPSFSKMQKQGVYKEASRSIANTLRHTRSLAISEHWEHQVEFDIAGKRYRVNRGDRANGSTGWDQVIQDWTSFSDSVQIRGGANCEITAGSTRLQFRPDGSCFWESSETPFICVMDGDTKRFRSGVTSRATGNVEILRWTGSWVR
jgi:Tfp pilus assembly protein FimT